jgi:prevent-host-death family protein
MESTNIHEAKTHFSRLVQRAAAGERIVIARAGKPMAMLVPYKKEKAKPRKLGVLKGKIKVHPSFYEDLPLEFFLGDEDDPLNE